MPDTSQYRILTCYHCGNKGLMKIEHVYTHNEGGPILDEADNIVDYDPIEKNNWILLSCPVCSNAMLYK